MQPITPQERRLWFGSRPPPPSASAPEREQALCCLSSANLDQRRPARLQPGQGQGERDDSWRVVKSAALPPVSEYIALPIASASAFFFFIATGSSQQENPLKCPWWESPGARVKVTAADANQPWLPYANAPSLRAPASKRDLFLSEPLINDYTVCFLLSVQKKSTGELYPACIQAHPFCSGSWVEFKSPDQFLIRNVFLSVGRSFPQI